MTSSRALARRLAATVRNAPLAVSAVALQALRDPGDVLLRVVGRVPGGFDARLLPGIDTVTAGMQAGDDASVLARAEAEVVARRVPRARRMVLLALTLDRTDLATRLCALLPDDAHTARLRARVLRRRGHYTEARSSLLPTSARDRWLLAQWRGEDELLAQVSHETPVERAASMSSAGPGDRARVVHLLTNSLPATNAGYTTRSQQVLLAQRRVGIDASALTRLGHPVAQGHLTAARSATVDGVVYRRSLPAGPLRRDPQRRFAQEVALAEGIVRSVSPDVLHAASNHWNGHVALEVGRRLGLPVAYEVRGFLEDSWVSRHDDIDADRTDRYRAERAGETAVMRAADLVTTLGEAMRDDIVARGVDPARVVVAPNGVDDRFLVVPEGVDDLRASLDLDATVPTVGLVSTLYRHEGIASLIDAVAALRDSGTAVQLLVVGDGPERAALEAQVAALKLTDRARFTGRVPFAGIERYYAALDVFCVPRSRSRVTALVPPLKPVEAMAVARPVVASDVGGLSEIVDPGRTGVLVAPDDPLALAEALLPLLYDPAQRRGLGEAAREWVAEHRTWDRIAQRYRDAYLDLVAR